MSSSEIQNPRFQPGVFICWGCLSRVGTMRSSLPRSMTSGRRLLEKALAVLQLFGVLTQRGVLNLRLDVCSWPFATFRYAAEFGRYRGIADIERVSAGNDPQRLTQRRHCNVLPLE